MNGEVLLELTSADIPGALDAFANAGIVVIDLNSVSELSVRFRVLRQDMSEVQAMSEKRGETLRQIRRMGIYWRIQNLTRHWVLLIGLSILIIMTAWVPTRVLFLRVEGNEQIPTRLILEKAAQCGIIFGAERGEVRSERMKNALLEAIPELQWAAVNTNGCVAVIRVEERQRAEELPKDHNGTLVANRDCVILEVTAVRGTAVVKPGQVVCSGEVLISGFTDCGGVILQQRAEGEVYGRTLRQIRAKTADNCLSKGKELSSERKISLIIGKKRINFYEDSGILDTGCVKMYSEYYLTLPGGLRLPVKLVVETRTSFAWTEAVIAHDEAGAILSDQVTDYLRKQMVAGSVLSSKVSTQGYVYFGEFICREMIGRMVHEEIVAEYGEDC